MAIDIGAAATVRASAISGYTLIGLENPANETGTITNIEIYANSTISNCEVATFFHFAGNRYSTRDSEVIGTVVGGAKRTFLVNLDVVAGDYLGVYVPSGGIYRDLSGGDGYWYDSGDQIPCTENIFSFAAGRTLSLYGTGGVASGGIVSNRRLSFIGIGSPVPSVLPAPDGTFGTIDRSQLLWLYAGFILIFAVAEPLTLHADSLNLTLYDDLIALTLGADSLNTTLYDDILDLTLKEDSLDLTLWEK